eukprot:361075-Chlamydomonas_euryale.AAC.5
MSRGGKGDRQGGQEGQGRTGGQGGQEREPGRVVWTETTSVGAWQCRLRARRPSSSMRAGVIRCADGTNEVACPVTWDRRAGKRSAFVCGLNTGPATQANAGRDTRATAGPARRTQTRIIAANCLAVKERSRAVIHHRCSFRVLMGMGVGLPVSHTYTKRHARVTAVLLRTSRRTPGRPGTRTHAWACRRTPRCMARRMTRPSLNVGVAAQSCRGEPATQHRYRAVTQHRHRAVTQHRHCRDVQWPRSRAVTQHRHRTAQTCSGRAVVQ